MVGWVIQLSGEKFDLEELPRLFTSEELKVLEKNGKYYLISNEFRTFTEASEVLKQAKKFIKLINGAVKISNSKFLSIRIGNVEKIEKNGRHMRYIFAESGTYRIKGSENTILTKSGSNQEEQITKRTFTVESWVMQTKQDKNVAKVLSFWSAEKITWIDLYKILEVIEEDIGCKVYKRHWVSRKKTRLFEWTANCYRAIGEDARHGGEKKWIPPKKCMELSEAGSIIRTITDNWLREKEKKLE